MFPQPDAPRQRATGLDGGGLLHRPDLTPAGKDGPSRLWLLVFPLLLLLTALCALHFYAAAPEVLPLHWHAGSKSGDSIPKSYAILWFFLIMQLFGKKG